MGLTNNLGKLSNMITSTGSAVGIGTSSPLTNTHIAGTNGVTDSFGQLLISTTNTATIDFGGQITLGGFFNGTTNQTAFGAIAGRKENSTANNALGYLSFSTQNGTINERMRITSAGNVGIGTSSPIAPLSIPSSVTNSQITTGSLEIQSFGTNNSWIADNLYYNNGFKARVTGYTSQIYFDTGGNIGFFTNNGVTTAGATSSLGQRMLITSAGSVGINGTPPSTVKLGVFGASATSSDYAFACYTNVGGNLIYVRNDGFLYSVSAWSGSDRRLKENITDLDNGLEKVLGLKARKYDLIDSFKNQFGFIAQEVQEVIPDAVSVFQEETQMLAIKMDFIVPHLVKAVQELSAQNQDLKSRLDKAGL